LPDSTAPEVEQSTTKLDAEFSRHAEIARRKVQILRELRHTLRRDRIETLKIVSQLLSDHTTDPIHAIRKKFRLPKNCQSRSFKPNERRSSGFGKGVENVGFSRSSLTMKRRAESLTTSLRNWIGTIPIRLSFRKCRPKRLEPLEPRKGAARPSRGA
jgi:hypothetical protein